MDPVAKTNCESQKPGKIVGSCLLRIYYYTNLLSADCIVVSDTDPDPDYWIKELDLFDLDLQCLRDGKDLSENVINAAQVVLKTQFKVEGFLATAKSQSLKYSSLSESVLCVQILYTGITTLSSLVCMYNNYSCSYELYLYTSLIIPLYITADFMVR